jgi:hypothetical protein
LWLIAIAMVVPGALFAPYYAHLLDGSAWFYNLRIFPYAELASCGLGFIAGMVHSWWQPEGIGEKAIVPAILLAIVLIRFVKPLLDPLDRSLLKDRFNGDICLQSTFSTCGPASAVTLMRFFGMDATESQIAKKCFTSRGGTEVWYIARALQRRGFSPSVVIQTPESANFPAPAIAGVRLGGGVGHFIAVMNSTDDAVTIADPLRGKSAFTKAELKRQYHFTGFFLVIGRKDDTK